MLEKTAQIHPTAVVPASASGGHCSIIEAGVVLGENVVIGDRCIIREYARIDAGYRLGDGVIVEPYARVRYEDQFWYAAKTPTPTAVSDMEPKGPKEVPDFTCVD